MKCFKILIFAMVLVAPVLSQEETTEQPTTELPITEKPLLPYGSICNGLLAQCNRYSETVACFSRRPDPSTTVPPTTEEPPTTEDPATTVVSIFGQKTPQEVCSTGLGVVLGRCHCARNCKQGVYVEDGEWDPTRELCVGLVDSTCTLLVPNCTQNGRCNLLTSKCVCNAGYEADENRRCVPNQV